MNMQGTAKELVKHDFEIFKASLDDEFFFLIYHLKILSAFEKSETVESLQMQNIRRFCPLLHESLFF